MDRVADLTLYSARYTTDDIGQQIATETANKLVCTLESIKRSEWVAANQLGYQPTITAIISEMDYNGEEIAELNNERYVVYRTYQRDDGKIELMLRKKVGENE